MIVFSITALAPSPKLDEAITQHFPNNHLQVAPTSWLVAAGGTAKEISDKLGLTEGALGSAIIFSTSGYYGLAPSNIWEWIKAKMEAPINA